MFAGRSMYCGLCCVITAVTAPCFNCEAVDIAVDMPSRQGTQVGSAMLYVGHHTSQVHLRSLLWESWCT